MNEGRALWWNQVCPRDKLNNSCDGTKFPAPSNPSSTTTHIYFRLLRRLPIPPLYCVQVAAPARPSVIALTAVKIHWPRCVKKCARHWAAPTNWREKKKGIEATFYMPIFLILSCTLLQRKQRFYFYFVSQTDGFWSRGVKGRRILSDVDVRTRDNKDQLGWSVEPLPQAKVPVSGGTGVGGMALSAPHSGRWQ